MHKAAVVTKIPLSDGFFVSIDKRDPMKTRIKKILILFVLAGIFYSWGCSSSGTDNTSSEVNLTVQANIAMSDAEDNPAVVEPVAVIQLNFSRQLNVDTINGNIELARIKASGGTEIIPCQTESLQNQVLLFKLDGTKLKEGEEYRLLIKKGILSTDGVTLAADFIGFF